jgi:hypothetical protein
VQSVAVVKLLYRVILVYFKHRPYLISKLLHDLECDIAQPKTSFPRENAFQRTEVFLSQDEV